MAKKIFKVIGITLGVFFVLLVIVVVVIFYNLPSAKNINQYFKKDKITQPQPQIKNNLVATATTTADKTTMQHNAFSEEALPVGGKEENANIGMDAEDIKRFMDQKTPISEFCDKLNLAKSGPVRALEKLNIKAGENKQLSPEEAEELNKEAVADLRFEAMMPLAKSILKKPEMQKLVTLVLKSEELEEAQKKNPESGGILDKAQFYRQIYSAYGEMKENLKEYESVVDRGYLFYKLNDLLALKPELQNDQRVRKFCDDSEHLFNTYTPVQFENEKQTFERLVSELGVDLKDIKYDPNYKTKLDIRFSANTLQMSGGWLSEIMTPTQSTQTQ